MTSDGPSDLETELSELSLQLLSLSQDLVTAKLRLESAARAGWILLAKARYVRGGVSMDQVPAGEGETEMVARVRLETRECLQDNKVRYFHHSLLEEGQDEGDEEDDGLKQRGADGTRRGDGRKRDLNTSEPLKWFGILTPPTLRQSQENFKTAAELAVECANIQSEMMGVSNRIKFIQRSIKSNKADTTADQLESSLRSSLKI